MDCRIGIDAGSKTIKAIILDEDGSTLFSCYRRHHADIRRALAGIVDDMKNRLGDADVRVALTGSAAIGIAEELGVPFVQEVVATTRALKAVYPEADAAIELGGEDAKVVYLSGGLEQRMNATCAGGTGGFIDTIAFMLDVDPADMSALAFKARTIHPIASRCAVFAQTDVRPLLNAGASKADIAASAYDAVTRQTIGGLACGRPVKGTVVFLGGPIEHAPYLVERFRRKLGLDERTGVKPPDAHLMTARGAALLASRDCAAPLTLAQLSARIAALGEPEDDLGRLDPLFDDDRELRRFRQRHRDVSFARARLADARGAVHLGIDAGSTTVKIAVVDEEGRLLHSAYEPIRGEMMSTLKRMLIELYDALPRDRAGNALVRIAHATATGYGEDLLRAGLGVDSGVVETAAHLRAALHLRPDATFLLDVGGQDMKALWIRDGQIVDAVLNEACSSGCGAFIEATAHALHAEPAEFAQRALHAARPVDLGTRCTVFMNSRVRHAQKVGASLDDIAAGVACSVVQNALYRIIGANRLDTLGDAIVVQGGTFKSDAVLRAFERAVGIEATRCEQAHLAGAIGAALVARERARDAAAEDRDACPDDAGDERRASARRREPVSTLLGRAELESLILVKRRRACAGCENRCPLDIVSFGNGRMHVVGNRCPRGVDAAARELGSPVQAESGPHVPEGNAPAPLDADETSRRAERREGPRRAPANLVAREQQLIASFKDVTAPAPLGTLRVGVLNALEAYEYTAFWHTLVSKLGFTTLMPDPDCATTCPARAWESIPSESVCHPAKSAHPRFYNLREKGADVVFMPKFERGNHCPVSCEYACALADNVEGPPLISPRLIGYKPTRIAQDEPSLDALHRAFNRAARAVGACVSRNRFDKAVEAALDAQRRFEETLVAETEDVLERLGRDASQHAVLLAGRPYHNDAAFMHGIDEELVRQGFSVLCMAGLASRLREARKVQYAGTYPWKPAKRLVRAATFVTSRPNVDMICLQSFGCGFDAMSIEEARGVLEEARRPCTALKIDDVSDIAHIRIRLRTLAEAIEAGARKRKAPGLAAPSPRPSRTVDDRAKAMPGRAPAIDPERILADPPLGALDLATARRDTVNDVCFTADVMAARVIRALRENPGIEAVELPLTCPDCLTEAVPRMVERATGAAPSFSWTGSWDAAANAARAHRDEIASAAASTRRGEPRPKVGVVGNPLLCFDPFMNDGLVDLLVELGCDPVLPDPSLIAVEDVRYLEQLARFRDDGVRDVVYLLSFGCLKGHVRGRGALHEIKRIFPEMHVTVVDYDPEASALNRENRIRLAAEAAREG